MNAWLLVALALPVALILALILAVIVALVLPGLLSRWPVGRVAWRKRGTPSGAMPVDEGGALDLLLEPLERAHPGQSGAALIDRPEDALLIRLAMAQMAERSLDLLYYMWEDDLAGRFLAQALLQAADRGVRVRLLLDDVNVLNHDPVYRALDRHPMIHVRLFNPVRNRNRGLRRGIEMLFSLLHYNRRMHGKLWITDGRLALTGGRNIGEAYFGLKRGGGHNYQDLDILLAGPVLRDTETLFDAFWNSGLATPIHTLWPGKRTRLQRFRRRLARSLRTEAATAALAPLLNQAPGQAPLRPEAQLPLAALRWSATHTFIGDPPQKALGEERDDWMPHALEPLLRGATRSLRVLTPYFVPGPVGLADLLGRARAGVTVEIITNGLALADNPLVHGAYRWYRERLCTDDNTRIFEVAARDGPRRMLHSKAMLVDDARGFVGSFNFDLRSAFLNTEMGVVFDDPRLLADLRAVMDKTITPEAAYCVDYDGRAPVWFRGDGPRTHLEPESTWIRRGVSYLIGHLPIHRLL